MAQEPGPSRPAIHTMKTDAQDLLQKEKTSFLDLIAQNKKLAPAIEPKPSAILPKIILVIIIISIIGGGGFLTYLFLQSQKEVSPPTQSVFSPPRPLLASDALTPTKFRLGDRTGLLEKLESLRTTSGFIYAPLIVANLTEEPRLATPSDFFKTLQVSPPSDLFSTFTGTWNVYSVNSGLILVFEIQVPQNLNRARGIMLGWEQTMPDDLRTLFPSVEPGTYSFADGIYKNIDTRSVKLSPTYDSTLSYTPSLALGRYLVIATSQAAMQEAINRFIALPPSR